MELNAEQRGQIETDVHLRVVAEHLDHLGKEVVKGYGHSRDGILPVSTVPKSVYSECLHLILSQLEDISRIINNCIVNRVYDIAISWPH